MTADGSSNASYKGNDPFADDFFLVLHEEETWARAEQVAEDNRDALRHHVELLVWELQGNPDLLKIAVSLLWLWDDVEPRWLAEASFMGVGDVGDLAESQPIVAFHCLDCGEQLQVRNRKHLIRMHHCLSSTLAIWLHGEPHRSSAPSMPVGLFVGSPRRPTRKKSPFTS